MMSNVKKGLVVFALCVLIVLSATNVFATGLIQIVDTNTATTNTAPVADTNTATTNTAVNTVTTTVNSVTNDTTLPKTGTTEDYAVISLILVGVALSIFTYRKIKAYNNI